MIAQDYGLSIAPHLLEKTAPLYVGCEFEIEDIKTSEDACAFLKVETDGSLRNNGVEYITFPTPVAEIGALFTRLHQEIVYGPEAFTERTSIHVHVNCSNMFPQEVRNIVLLYALFEESFFAMVDPHRRNNIHCVALTETYLPNHYKLTLNSLITKWHKYTALNIKPLGTQGTIEFRHMHGHNDVTLFTEWISVLQNLVTYGRVFKVNSHSLDEKALENMFNNLFGTTRLREKWTEQRALMDNQIIDVKLSTIN